MSSDDRGGVSSPGRIVAVHVDLIDIEFPERLPNINDALEVRRQDETLLVLEVHDHLSPTVLQAIALGSTQGLRRDMAVRSTVGLR